MQRVALRRGGHSLPGFLGSKSNRYLINNTRVSQRTYADAAAPKDHARQGGVSRGPLYVSLSLAQFYSFICLVDKVSVLDLRQAHPPSRLMVALNRTQLTTNRITLAVILTIVPAYYFLHSNRAPASGYQSRKEARIGTDPSKEYRDPRDSGVKTLEQKRKRDEAGQ
jgi:hypothetical protein